MWALPRDGAGRCGVLYGPADVPRAGLYVSALRRLVGAPGERALLLWGRVVTQRIVGITGYAGSGKDTAAAALVARGWRRVGVADAVKRLAVELGWSGAKDDAPTGRPFLVALGDGVRRECGAGAWLAAVAATVDAEPATNWVIPDVRYPNEADWLRERGGILLRIDRPGCEPMRRYRSECTVAELRPHAVIVNATGADALQAATVRAVERLGGVL